MLIGATAALYGPTIPAFRATFHITAATAGLLLSGHFAGSLAGTLGPSFLPARYRSPRLVATAGLLPFALGCALIAAAPTFPVAVGGALVEGAGWGALVIAFNSLFAAGYGERSTAMLTLLNATYGIGAIAAPAGVGLFTAGSFRPPFLAVAVLALLFLPLFRVLPGARPAIESGVRDAASLPIRLPLLITFIAAFFLYGGLEGGIAAWEPTHLVAAGLSVSAAAGVTSLFWAAYTGGRLLAAGASLLVGPERLVAGSLAVLSVLLLLTRVTSLTAAAYTVGGLAIAPIFPLALVWSSRVLPASQRVTSFVISGDLVGGVILSVLLGRLITATSAFSLPFAFAAMSAGCLLLLTGIRVTTGRTGGAPP